MDKHPLARRIVRGATDYPATLTSRLGEHSPAELIARVPFFFKQWGEWGMDGRKRSKKVNGRLYSGEVWDAIPA